MDIMAIAEFTMLLLAALRSFLARATSGLSSHLQGRVAPSLWPRKKLVLVADALIKSLV